ncbi:MAG: hypothetical protein OXE78_06955 [Gammaproteobacteria bacterium]|nr:hypothetical protein [Gammaproteobacteria bacterium]MCY4357826.1 hypothetical protein [Gammaproteobacteria bacterium]
MEIAKQYTPHISGYEIAKVLWRPDGRALAVVNTTGSVILAGKDEGQ